ncbi:M20 family metallopeptidase [Halorubrum aethiopicum]|uniref:M20 family metallopeptidase n=1 Tax=Halorubrum aethiopicum TaxID=1758255 RepID=UPI00082D358B|nr:ArgE/DapE family deacylase [Halorubrum aethiopicum]
MGVNSLTDTYDDELKRFVERLLQFESTSGREKQAQEWFEEQLEELGFETYRWEADPEQLASISSFPSADEIDTADRPSVAGVLEFGDPEAGPTLVLNGHVDVVPADDASWKTDPFDPYWDGEKLHARGAADMKTNLALLVFVAKHLHDSYADEINGRVVVESVTGEEEGGIGAPAAALSNPYPFDRDAAIITEPTDQRVVTATAGVLMKELTISGRSAHAATRWRGESVLPHFNRIQRAFRELEHERHERITHPLYDYPVNWPMNIGIVDAGDWVSNVPARLTAQVRIGFAPSETLEAAEAEYEERLQSIVEDSKWLSEHPPTFERRAIHFEPSELEVDCPIVRRLQSAMLDHGIEETQPIGKTYSADSRFYIEQGIPTVIFGPGTIDQAHFPNEFIRWSEVQQAGDVLVDTCKSYLQKPGSTLQRSE